MNSEFNWGWGAQSPQSTAQPTNRSPCTVGDIPLLTIRPLNDPGATNGFLLSIGSPEGRLLRALRVFGANLTNHFTSWTVSFIRERLLLIRAQEIPDCQQSRCHHAYDPYQPPLRKFGARKREHQLSLPLRLSTSRYLAGTAFWSKKRIYRYRQKALLEQARLIWVKGHRQNLGMRLRARLGILAARSGWLSRPDRSKEPHVACPAGSKAGTAIHAWQQ